MDTREEHARDTDSTRSGLVEKVEKFAGEY